MYVKFCNFGVYADEKAAASKQQQKQASPASADVYRKVILYRRLSAVLLLICVLLLAVLLALAVKLSEAKSSQECPTNAVDVERTTAGEVCSRSVCEAMYPPGRIQAPNGHACSECGRGWLKFEDSCYFLSQTRLNWLQSREQCKKMGGDLVVISNERVQRFLTQNGLMMYWIGLSRSDSQQWTWINNTVLMNSYWSDTRQDGDCVFLNGGSKPRKNWYPNQCAAVSHYICQKTRRTLWRRISQHCRDFRSGCEVSFVSLVSFTSCTLSSFGGL
uniref:Si:dkey-26c10.5 n=1 Tax=Astyanax mexicanus TaxID=7994 RepID=W5LJF5_ASTMX